MAFAMSKKDTDMTTGSVFRHLLVFAIPLLVGNLFQQMYNTVDSIVVGNYVGKEALAAVGSVAQIINVLIGFFNGFATGAGVVISQHYGAHERDQVHKAVQTTMAFTFLLSAFLTVFGVVMVPAFLRMMQTPEDVIEQAALYLRIYFAGVSGLLVYNMGAGILRAVGDSRRPLYFLILSAVLNTALDIYFVASLKMGIAGVAIATIIAQFISAALILVVLSRTTGDYRIVWKDVRIDKPMLGHIVRIGLPSAIQLALTAFSNVFVQSYINRFGSSVMAGYTSYSKIDQFVFLPLTSLSLAATVFVGQNLGAGYAARAKKGTYTALLMAECSNVILIVPLMIFAPQLIALFSNVPDVLSYGALFIRTISPFYAATAVNQVIAGSLKGAGDTRTCMIIMLSSFVVFRQIYLAIIYNLTHQILPVAMGYPAGWVVCSIACLIYYRSGRWKRGTVYRDTVAERN